MESMLRYFMVMELLEVDDDTHGNGLVHRIALAGVGGAAVGVAAVVAVVGEDGFRIEDRGQFGEGEEVLAGHIELGLAQADPADQRMRKVVRQGDGLQAQVGGVLEIPVAALLLLALNLIDLITFLNLLFFLNYYFHLSEFLNLLNSYFKIK